MKARIFRHRFDDRLATLIKDGISVLVDPIWQLASPEEIMPKLSAEEEATEQKIAEIARKRPDNAKRRRIRAAAIPPLRQH
ncbi:hypothetical protein NKH99_25405 [Mesorhizobium sp. M0854]|uniref:hypothetical protein n=1 Tax=Mesorhizobium sp. M0854 TaxID=2957013 RepID=UPI00333719BD